MTPEEKIEFEELTLKLFEDKDVIEADLEDPVIKRFLFLRDSTGEETNDF